MVAVQERCCWKLTLIGSPVRIAVGFDDQFSNFRFTVYRESANDGASFFHQRNDYLASRNARYGYGVRDVGF